MGFRKQDNIYIYMNLTINHIDAENIIMCVIMLCVVIFMYVRAYIYTCQYM